MRYGFHASTVFVWSVAPTGYGRAIEQRLAVGHHQVGLEARAGEPAADHRDGADRVGHDLAVAAEALGDRDHAVLGAVIRSVVAAHSPTTFRYSAWSPQSRYFAFHAAHASGVFALAAYSFWNASSRP